MRWQGSIWLHNPARCWEDPGRLHEIEAILGAVAGRVAEQASRAVRTVRVADDDALAHAIRRLESAGIGVAEIALRLPSLDEVFFALTGYHTTHNDQHEKESA